MARSDFHSRPNAWDTGEAPVPWAEDRPSIYLCIEAHRRAFRATYQAKAPRDRGVAVDRPPGLSVTLGTILSSKAELATLMLRTGGHLVNVGEYEDSARFDAPAFPVIHPA